MTSHLVALSSGAHDPLGLAQFWSGVLGREMTEDPHDDVTLPPHADTGFRIRFVASQQQKSGPNQVHLHLTSASVEDQQSTVARSFGLGGRHLDIGLRRGRACGARRPRGQRVLRADSPVADGSAGRLPRRR